MAPTIPQEPKLETSMPLETRLHRRATRSLRRLAASCLLALAPASAALPPALEVTQYAHSSWTARGGDFRGSVNSITQTRDGYLWLGTGFGPLRFDGVRFVPWQPPPGTYSGLGVNEIFGGSDGSLWIGGMEGLARWRDGVLTQYPQLDGVNVFAIQETRDGKVWAGGLRRPATRLCSIATDGPQGAGEVRCLGDDGAFGEWLRALHEDGAGRLWAASARGVWRLQPGPPEHFPLPGNPTTPTALAEDAEGRLLVASDFGLSRLIGGRLEPAVLGPESMASLTSLLRDRDGALWLGTTDKGLVHVGAGGADRYSRVDGLSAEYVRELFEDAEGNVWVTTVQGLDRFHRLAVPTATARQGLPSGHVTATLATRDGSLWVGSHSGISRQRNGVTTFGRDLGLSDEMVGSLFEDRRGRLWLSQPGILGLAVFDGTAFRRKAAHIINAFQITDDAAGHLWISDRETGLSELGAEGDLVARTPWSQLGGRVALSIAADPTRGGLWLGFIQGGLGYVEQGSLREVYEEADGLGTGQVRDVQVDAAGVVWASTQGGLSRLAGGRVTTLASAGGLPCDTVHWMRPDASGDVWLYAACGLIRLARGELDTWAADPSHRVQILDVLDHSDGVDNLLYNGYYTPYVTRTADGRLHYATTSGLATLDPAHLPFNPLPPPVHVEEVVADGVVVDLAAGGLRLPPQVRDLRIDYTATSFVAPLRVRFRYRLEGYEADWQEAEGRRQAFYRELPPGRYTFRVIACNDDGVWNEQGATLALEVLPAFHQTTTFRLLALGVAAFLAWAAYRWRVGQVTRRLAEQYEDRLAERTRIAQELHDTLLQGFISASMQLSVAVARTPADAPERSRLDHVLALVRRVIEDGRNAVRGLRSPAGEADDLERAFGRVPAELGLEREVELRVVEPDGARTLRAIARDDVFGIGREALVNALRHAQAARIAVELDYRPAAFHLRVFDDGIGIDPEVRRHGREGHWGMAGMRERAARLGGRLTIANAPERGSVVELVVPAAVAYEGRRQSRVNTG